MPGAVGTNVRPAVILAVVLTCGAIASDSAIVGWLVAPFVIAALFYVMNKVPLRTSLLTLTFFALTLENPTDIPAAGRWQSPLFILGSLMLMHLNNTTGLGFLVFSGMDVILVTLFYIAYKRRKRGMSIDRVGWVPVPEAYRKLAFVSMAGTAWVWFIGMLRGGIFAMSLWQINQVIYIPLFFLLFAQGLRGPQDHRALAKVLLAAASVRGVAATFIMNTVKSETGGQLQYATSHHDSMLFAMGAVLVLSLLVHGGNIKRKTLLFCLALIFSGVVYNLRRMAWVQIALALTVLYFVMPTTPVKKRIRKTMLYLSPLIAAYVAVGWNSNAGIFGPVHSIRAAVQPATDPSAMTREIENYDLIYTLAQHPFVGYGYGNRYFQIIPLPPMPHPMEPYMPHNSFLGLWCFAGYPGFTAMCLLWVGGVYCGIRAYRFAKDPEDRTAAVMTFAAVLIYLIQCWGDLGLGSWAGVFLVAPSLAIAGKLAVATGAWPLARPSAKPQPIAASALR